MILRGFDLIHLINLLTSLSSQLTTLFNHYIANQKGVKMKQISSISVSFVPAKHQHVEYHSRHPPLANGVLLNQRWLPVRHIPTQESAQWVCPEAFKPPPETPLALSWMNHDFKLEKVVFSRPNNRKEWTLAELEGELVSPRLAYEDVVIHHCSPFVYGLIDRHTLCIEIPHTQPSPPSYQVPSQPFLLSPSISPSFKGKVRLNSVAFDLFHDLDERGFPVVRVNPTTMRALHGTQGVLASLIHGDESVVVSLTLDLSQTHQISLSYVVCRQLSLHFENVHLNPVELHISVEPSKSIEKAAYCGLSVLGRRIPALSLDDYQSIFQNYLQHQIAIQRGSIIAVPIPKSTLRVQGLCRGVRVVYYLVDRVDGEGKVLFLDRNETTVVLSGYSATRLPIEFPHLQLSSNSQLDEMVRIFHPRHMDRVQSSLVCYGGDGAGMRGACASLAALLGYHLHFLSPLKYSNPSSHLQTEIDVKRWIDQQLEVGPSVVVLEDLSLFPAHLGPIFKQIIAQYPNHQLILIALSNDHSPLSTAFDDELSFDFPSNPQKKRTFLTKFQSDRFPFGFRHSEWLPHSHGLSIKDMDLLAHLAHQSSLARFPTLPKALLEASLPILDNSDILSSIAKLRKLQKEKIGAAKVPNVRWEDIGGLEHVKKELLDTIQLPLEHPELFDGDKKRSGILLYGPPGTGKTLLAKAVATECTLHFMSVKGPELINMYIGESEKNVRNLFEKARLAKPCVIFFDELDALAPSRGVGADSGGVMDRIVSQLLTELDGMHDSSDIFVIGATNRLDMIDSALLRPGRFDKAIHLDVAQTKAEQLLILKALTASFGLNDDVLPSILPHVPSRISGAELYAICADAYMEGMKEDINLLESLSEEEASSLVQEWEAIPNRQPSISASHFFTALRFSDSKGDGTDGNHSQE